MNHKKYYITNKKYTKFLATQNTEDFKKYTDFVLKYAKKGSSFLDVGCGTGIAVDRLVSGGIKAEGVEISQTSVRECRKKKLKCIEYNGSQLPFEDESFDAAGSYNVLEHTENPINFLNEQLRVVKKGGYILVSCPNFLSITNSYHHHTKGVVQKVTNLFTIFSKFINPKFKFEKMKTVDREDFQPDDDACNVTNSQDILRWGKSKNLKVIYWSSQPVYKEGLTNYLDFSLFKFFLGACFIIFVKNEK